MKHRTVDDSGLVDSLLAVPADAAAVLCFLVAADALLVYGPTLPPLIQAAVAAPLLFFLPGYAIVSVLFPTGPRPSDRAADGRSSGVTISPRPLFHRDAIDGVERAALSFGMSVVALPLVGVALAAAGVGISLPTVTEALSTLVVAGLLVATLRRWQYPESRRFRVRYRAAINRGVAGVTGSNSRVDSLLNVALAVAILTAFAGVSYAVTVPHATTAGSSVELLTEGPDGELTASGYPATLAPTDDTELVFSVTNRDGEATQFVVVAQLQRVSGSGADAQVTERSELGRWQSTLENGETWTNRHSVTPTMSGEDLRLAYYVYRGEAPATATAESAARRLHIWVDVPGGEATGSGPTATGPAARRPVAAIR